ncbi:SDR family NAD(P)-dependent oxidoreductase [Yinghuangia soli]|uniref:SDR family oxidoreductase n=1 Tax=Yinghuangia soli TaxID=2908204 RepID=A0AA41Q6I3_9ACTN|nr:SDR family oxidoreductase [Yinghuangia soli]MCF2531087.1 SDR family oxidoreductase [Yinghuangia soli]
MTITISLAGQTALVTGAGAGIGRAIAVRLAQAGANVAVTDIVATAAHETSELVRAEGREGLALVGDMTDPRRVDDMVEETVRHFGALNIGVNNVGMLGKHGAAPYLDWSSQAMADVVAGNLLATMYSCQAEAAAMIPAGRGGVIVNVSSGETTRPAVQLAPYGAAKAGINHLTQTLAIELAPHRIRVNAAAPGTTLTQKVAEAFSAEHRAALQASIPLDGEFSAPEDLADLVLLLASDLAAHTTGQFLLSDKGAFLSRSRPAPTTH